MPKVSIIIAVYNVEKYLRQCLDSLVNQTLQDIEFICVNDGSTDKSLEILQEYASKDSRFKIITQENQGPGIARNNAIEIATGDYIMILDPDDWLELNACELAYNQIFKNQNDMVLFTSYKYYEKTKRKELYNYRIKPFKNHLDKSQIKFCELENDFIKTPYTWEQIYSREFINENNIRYTHEKLGEDLYFWIKAVTSSKSFSILNIPIHNYRIRENSAVQAYLINWYDLFSTRYYCLNLVKDLPVNYVNAYLIFILDSLCWWYKKMSIDRTLNKEIYGEFRKFFVYISSNYNLDTIKSYIDYKEINRICSKSWGKMIIELTLKKAFEIKNVGKHKIINIFGIKISIKRKF